MQGFLSYTNFGQLSVGHTGRSLRVLSAHAAVAGIRGTAAYRSCSEGGGEHAGCLGLKALVSLTWSPSVPPRRIFRDFASFVCVDTVVSDSIDWCKSR